MWLAAFFRTRIGLCLTVLLLALLASGPLVFGLERDSVLTIACLALSAVVCFIAIPLAIITYVLKEDPRTYGWRFPEKGAHALLYTVLVLIPHAVLAVFLAQDPAFKEFYTPEGTRLTYFALSAVLLPAIYFLAEEFLFRGFLLFALWNRYQYWGAAISVALFALLHFAKPPLEIFLAVISGALLCWLSLKTKSFVPAAVVHFCAALILNVLVAFS